MIFFFFEVIYGKNMLFIMFFRFIKKCHFLSVILLGKCAIIFLSKLDKNYIPNIIKSIKKQTKIWWKSYYELNAEKIETRKNLRKIFHPERACLTAPLKILMTIFLEFQIRAENIYFQKPSFFSEFAWILTFVFIFLV